MDKINKEEIEKKIKELEDQKQANFTKDKEIDGKISEIQIGINDLLKKAKSLEDEKDKKDIQDEEFEVIEEEKQLKNISNLEKILILKARKISPEIRNKITVEYKKVRESGGTEIQAVEKVLSSILVTQKVNKPNSKFKNQWELLINQVEKEKGVEGLEKALIIEKERQKLKKSQEEEFETIKEEKFQLKTTNKLKDRLFNLFKRSEKIKETKAELYTPEEEKAFYDNIKTMIEKGEDKERLNDIILKKVEERRNLEMKKFSGERIVSSVNKGLEKWDSWGKEGGVKGNLKKFTKMAASLALIGAISYISVDKAAELGIGSAGALSNGFTSTIGKKMAIGLGFGGLMQGVGKMSPEQKQKIQKIMKWVLVGGSATFAIASGAGAVAGAGILGSALAGWGAGKLLKNKFSENLEEKYRKQIEEIKNREINPNNLESEIKQKEDDLKKVTKSYERNKFWKRILTSSIAIGTSIATLEVAGAVHGLKTDDSQSLEEPIDKSDSSYTKMEADSNIVLNTSDSNATIRPDSTIVNQPDSIITNHPDSTVVSHPDSTTVNHPDSNITTPPQQAPDQNIPDNTTTQTDYEFKIESVEISSKGAIQTIIDLREKINNDYPDLSKAPESVQEFMKTDPTQEAIKLGLFNPDNPEESMMVLKGSTMSFDEDGNLSYHDIKTGEDHILINQTGEIEQYEGEMFDSDKSDASVDNNTTEDSDHPNSSINEDPNNPEETKQDNLVDEEKGKDIKETEGTKDTENVFTDKNKNTTGDLKGLIQEQQLKEVNEIYTNNINSLFPDGASIEFWNLIKDSQNSPAHIVLGLRAEEVQDSYKPFIDFMHKLHKETGLDPIRETLTNSAETNSEYVKRALLKAAEMGKLEQFKL